MAVLEKLAFLPVLQAKISILLAQSLEFLDEVLLQAVETRLQVLFLCAVLGDQLREAVLYPDLVIVGHVTTVQQVEALDGLDKVAAELLPFLLSQLEFGLLQGADVVDVHSALHIYADQVLLPAARGFDKLCEHEDRLVSELLQRSPLVRLCAGRLVNDDLLDLVLADDESHLSSRCIVVEGQDLALPESANLELISPPDPQSLPELQVDDQLVAAELQHLLLTSLRRAGTAHVAASTGRCRRLPLTLPLFCDLAAASRSRQRAGTADLIGLVLIEAQPPVLAGLAILAEVDSARRVAEYQGALAADVLARGEPTALQLDSRVDHHFVDIDDIQLATVREDKDVTRVAFDSLERQHPLVGSLCAFSRRIIAGRWAEKLRGAGANAATIVGVPEAQAIVRMERAQPESARIENPRGWTSHDALRHERARSLALRRGNRWHEEHSGLDIDQEPLDAGLAAVDLVGAEGQCARLLVGEDEQVFLCRVKLDWLPELRGRYRFLGAPLDRTRQYISQVGEDAATGIVLSWLRLLRFCLLLAGGLS